MLSISLTAVPVLTLPAFCGGKTLLSQVSCFFSIVFFFFKHHDAYLTSVYSPTSCSLSCEKLLGGKHSILSQNPHLRSTSGLSRLRPPTLSPRSRSAQMQCEILSDTLRSLASVHIRRRVSIRNGTMRGGHPHCDFLP